MIILEEEFILKIDKFEKNIVHQRVLRGNNNPDLGDIPQPPTWFAFDEFMNTVYEDKDKAIKTIFNHFQLKANSRRRVVDHQPKP